MSLETEHFDEFEAFLRCLKESECLDKVLIIGSWAEYIYNETGIVKREDFKLITKDADFLILPESPLKLKESPKKELIKNATKQGFIHYVDYKDGFSKFSGATEDFEVEFLIPQHGDGSKGNIPNSLDVHPIPMPHMHILINNSFALTYKDFSIQAPIPEAYAVHKIVINHSRGLKAESDREKIHAIIPYLNSKRTYEIVDALTKKERKAYNLFLEKYEPDFDVRISSTLKKQLHEQEDVLILKFTALPFTSQIGEAGRILSDRRKEIQNWIKELENPHIDRDDLQK